MTLQGWDRDSKTHLFAHVVSLSVNAVHEAWNRRPRALAHGDCLAQAVDLDMAALGWMPTADNFLGRVTKARILQAVAEAKGQDAADRIAHLKKGDMAAEAETLLANTGWLPEPLRTLTRDASTVASTFTADESMGSDESIGVDTPAEGHDTVLAEPEPSNEDEASAAHPSAMAAE